MTKTVAMPDKPTDNQIEACLHLLDMRPTDARKTIMAIYKTLVDMRPEARLPSGLTKKQAQLMEVLQEHEEKHDRAPTQEDLAAIFGCDRRLIIYRLKALEKKGYLYLSSKHRGITIRKKMTGN